MGPFRDIVSVPKIGTSTHSNQIGNQSFKPANKHDTLVSQAGPPCFGRARPNLYHELIRLIDVEKKERISITKKHALCARLESNTACRELIEGRLNKCRMWRDGQINNVSGNSEVISLDILTGLSVEVLSQPLRYYLFCSVWLVFHKAEAPISAAFLSLFSRYRIMSDTMLISWCVCH